MASVPGLHWFSGNSTAISSRAVMSRHGSAALASGLLLSPSLTDEDRQPTQKLCFLVAGKWRWDRFKVSRDKTVFLPPLSLLFGTCLNVVLVEPHQQDRSSQWWGLGNLCSVPQNAQERWCLKKLLCCSKGTPVLVRWSPLLSTLHCIHCWGIGRCRGERTGLCLGKLKSYHLKKDESRK